MLICPNCKRTIDESDLTYSKSFLAYRGDEPIYENNADGCSCGGEWEEAEKCSCCEEWCTDSDLTMGWRYNIKVCKGCIDFYKNKYQRIYNQLTLNGIDEFLDWLVDKGEINE